MYCLFFVPCRVQCWAAGPACYPTAIPTTVFNLPCTLAPQRQAAWLTSRGRHLVQGIGSQRLAESSRARPGTPGWCRLASPQEVVWASLFLELKSLHLRPNTRFDARSYCASHAHFSHVAKVPYLPRLVSVHLPRLGHIFSHPLFDQSYLLDPRHDSPLYIAHRSEVVKFLQPGKAKRTTAAVEFRFSEGGTRDQHGCHS